MVVVLRFCRVGRRCRVTSVIGVSCCVVRVVRIRVNQFVGRVVCLRLLRVRASGCIVNDNHEPPTLFSC